MTPVVFDEDLEIDDANFSSSSLIIGVRDVHVDGTGFLDDEGESFDCDYHLSCTMLCPDAITSEVIEVPFETDSHETYSFVESEDDGVRFVADEVIDLLPAVIETIMLEVPISVTDADENDYPSGDGWRVITEAEYQESQKNRIDPRLAKLKEFKGE